MLGPPRVFFLTFGPRAGTEPLGPFQWCANSDGVLFYAPRSRRTGLASLKPLMVILANPDILLAHTNGNHLIHSIVFLLCPDQDGGQVHFLPARGSKRHGREESGPNEHSASSELRNKAAEPRSRGPALVFRDFHGAREYKPGQAAANRSGAVSRPAGRPVGAHARRGPCGKGNGKVT